MNIHFIHKATSQIPQLDTDTLTLSHFSQYLPVSVIL